MKILFSAIMLLALSVGVVSAQNKFNKSVFNTRPGYITINELTAGWGIGGTNVPFSKSYAGINTIHGYQINQRFVVGFGTGLSFYNGGTLLPLFMDFRYRFIHNNEITTYCFGDGGLLFNVSDKTGATRLFINPGIGMRYDLSRQLGANLGMGILLQQGTNRDTFVNIKVGLTYKPR